MALAAAEQVEENDEEQGGIDPTRPEKGEFLKGMQDADDG